MPRRKDTPHTPQQMSEARKPRAANPDTTIFRPFQVSSSRRMSRTYSTGLPLRSSGTDQGRRTVEPRLLHANAIAAAPVACRLRLKCPDRPIVGVVVTEKRVDDPAPVELHEHHIVIILRFAVQVGE